MANLAEMISNVKLRLGDPLPQSPSARHLFRLVLDHCQSVYNHLNNTSQAWATAEIPLAVAPGQGDYLLNAGQWGKALLIYTEDPSNPGHWERTVPFYEVQNINLAYEGPNDGANGFAGFVDGSNHTAFGIAFLRDQNGANVSARVRPIPQAAATYRILYSIGDWASGAALGSVPVLPEHHHLIEVRAALSALPIAKWWVGGDKDTEKLNQNQRLQYAASLRMDEARYTRDFELYVRSQTGRRVGFRSGYGSFD
jgi:hypothetical protein